LLIDLLEIGSKRLNEIERLELFLERIEQPFSRKEYLKYHSALSTATASRDLKKGVDVGLLEKFGDKNKTYYRKK
jgi:Fic family protein